MAIHQTKQQSDLEKRLKLLRQQVYGSRESVASSKYHPNTHTTNYQVREASQLPALRLSSTQTRGEPTTNLPNDVTYLRADLMKISILAGTALGLQIILYFLIKNNLLNINNLF